jgi:hypothetical protein
MLARVRPEDLVTWLTGWCEQQEAEHYERLAQAEQSLRRAEDLSTENLRVVGSLDIGIDL